MVDDIDDLRIAYQQAMNTIEQTTAEIEQHLRTVERQMGSISQMAHTLYDKDKQIERLRAAGDGLIVALKDARAAMCDYAHQGTGTDPESPEWENFCMSIWEGVPDDLAAVDAAIAAYEEARREG